MSIPSGTISRVAAFSFAPFLRLRTFKFFASNLLCRAVRLSLAPSSFSFFHSLPVDGPRENTAAAEESCTLARKNSHGDPTRCVAEIVNRLKGGSSRILRGEFPHLKSRLPTLWSRSYYAGTVGHNSEATVKKYIANQKGR